MTNNIKKAIKTMYNNYMNGIITMAEYENEMTILCARYGEKVVSNIARALG